MNKLTLIRKSDKPIGDYNSEKDIRTQLMEICDIVKVPLEDVTENERQRIVTAIKFYYPKFCAKELSLAFEYAISGLFEAETQHYNQLSYKYIAGVLNKYRVYVSNRRMDTTPVDELPHISEETKRQICIADTKTIFEQYKNNRDKLILAVFYDFLDSEGVKMLFNGNTLENYIKLAQAKLSTERNKEQSNKKKTQVGDGNIIRDSFNSKPLNEAKSMIVKDFFTYLIDNDKTLEL